MPGGDGILPNRHLFHNFVAEFLDYWIGKNFLGHFFDLFFGGFAGHAVQIEDEKLALADVGNVAKSKRRKGMLYCLALWIEYCAFRHNPYVCFHGRNYTKPRAATLE